jgi:hypothetical protein
LEHSKKICPPRMDHDMESDSFFANNALLLCFYIVVFKLKKRTTQSTNFTQVVITTNPNATAHKKNATSYKKIMVDSEC